jgi:ribonuclease P protein component
MKKEYRVKKSEEIEKIIKARQSVGNKYYILYKMKNNETSHFRYATSVSKKLGKANIRNRLKRQVVSIIDNLPINLNLNYDVFIIVRKTILDIDYDTMKNELEYLFVKGKLLSKGDK